LRIETSDPKLYSEIHPKDDQHSYTKRLECLHMLSELDYQVGTGVMIGIPGQSEKSLADDLFFMQKLNIDMCGMGPYIEHSSTPMYEPLSRTELIRRADLTLRMIALLRILMKDINIAATTALETISSAHRYKAFDIGANVVMPNLTPMTYQEDYLLYDGKQSLVGTSEKICSNLKERLSDYGLTLELDSRGTSIHYLQRTQGDFYA
jgi:biotin synthase